MTSRAALYIDQISRYIRADWFAMFAAYFDDSGSHSRPTLAVGCVLSGPRKWTKFERQWQKMLNAFGVRLFRMSQFESRVGDFDGWSNKKRLQFITRAADILDDGVIFFGAYSMILQDYRDVLVPAMRVGDSPKTNAYTLLLQSCLEEIVTHLGDVLLPAGQRVACFFERGDPDVWRALLESYNWLLELHPEWRHIFGTISFPTKDEALQLQAADLVAYEGYKHTTNQHVEDASRPVRKLFLRLVETGRFNAGHYDKVALARFLDKVLAVERDVLGGL